MNYLLIIAFLIFASIQSPQQSLRPVYDARSLSGPPPRTKLAPYQSIFKQEILPAARRVWRDKASTCDQVSDKFVIIDVAQGSFTKPGANQNAILYKYCETAHNFALDGIAITEGGRVVAHVAYEGGWDAAIASLPDVNGNGLSEILIDTRGMNQGEGWGVISIIELSANAIRKLGNTQTETETCGAISDHHSEAYVIHAKPGRTPVFYRDTYVRSCRANARWRKPGTLKQITLDEDATEYKRIK